MEQIQVLKKEVLAHEIERSQLKNTISHLQNQLKQKVRGQPPTPR